MRIGELADQTGVSRRSLRYYEQHDLLHARRGHHGWRDYDDAAVSQVRAIAEMLGNGLTLDGVKALAPCLEPHEPSACTVPDLPLQTYRARLAVVDKRLTDLQRDRDRLTREVHAREPGR